MSRILHLGLGRFHRAHQAVYFSRLGPEWTISAWSMRDPAAADGLGPEGYEVVVPGQPRERIRSIVETGFAPRDRERWRAAWLDPELLMVTLTVTEKGYAPALFASLAEAAGWRRAAGLADPTWLSCDNLRSNGLRLRVGLESAGLQGCLCPNSVVDRIVPAGHDPLLITTEAYSQWVIEGNWPHPPLEQVGVRWVADVTPYEEMKLGLLNLGHSWLAYAGLLRGYVFVHEAMADTGLVRSLEAIHSEASGFLSLPRAECREYAAQVRQRFQNSHLPHPLSQIAMDGSQKLPQRLFPLLRQAPDSPTLGAVLDAWLEFVRRGPVQDPLEASLAECRGLPPAEYRSRVLGLLGFEQNHLA